MKRLGFLLILCSILLTCQDKYNKSKKPYSFIPKESSPIIEIKELNDFSNAVKNHDVLSKIYNNELNEASKILKFLHPKKELYIAFPQAENGSSDYLILTEDSPNLFLIDSIPNLVSETLIDLKIEKTQIDSTTFYHKTVNNIFATSNNLDIIKDLDSSRNNKELINLIETTSKKSVASVIFKSNDEIFSKLLFNSSKAENDKLGYTVLDLNYNESNLKYNGIISSKDSVFSKLGCFKNSQPQHISTPKFVSRNITSFISISFDDFSIFNKNLFQLNTKGADTSQTFLNFTNEIAFVENNNENAIILHALDTDLVLESIEERTNLETFRSLDIYSFEASDFFQSRLNPFFNYDNANYFAVYENFVVFSETLETLKSLLIDALNNNTLSNSDAYINISENLSDEASLFIFKNSESISKLFAKNLDGYNANAVQYIYEKDYAHVNGVIQKFKKRAVSKSVTEAFTIEVDAEIIVSPQTVVNHVSKAHDIVVQDVNNVLYLISSSGNVLWKKQLQGKILGEIEQMDMYKNGRLQLVFATKNRVYVLDRNGNDASPFPLKFNDDITQPLSVFDYDRNKNYRLLVTQGRNLLMYDAKGKTVTGFEYKNNGQNIQTQPKHFRVGNKDYIAFTTDNKMLILNRQGNIRVPVKDKINFSDNELHFYQSKFTSSNTLGELIQVNTSGKLSKKNLNLPENHRVTTTSKTLVSLTENKLNIKSRTVDLDFGNYTEPRIFYLNDKIFVTVTDKQAKKVFLFDSQAKPISNFPVFGTAPAVLQKLDEDRGLELITQSDLNTMIVYKLH